MRVALLTFENRTASELHEFHIQRDAVSLVMDWYGAFYAGDDYSVYANGAEQPQGINGELQFATIDAQATPADEE